MSHYTVLVITDQPEYDVIATALAPFEEVGGPNDRWDWWLIGGRWTGMLRCKDPTTTFLGEPGIMTPTPTDKFACDQAQVKNLDHDAMQAARKQQMQESWKEARERYDEMIANPNNFEGESAEERSKKIRAELKWRYGVDPMEITEEQYVATVGDGAPFETFAILKDGNWMEKGDMGWWAIVTNAKDPEDWSKEFKACIDSLDPEDWITVVDCHI